jgi:hypothetical protein
MTYGKSRALVIGINTYHNASPLGYAVQDAKAVAETLVSELLFDRDCVQLLLDEDATKSSILRAYMSLCQRGTEENDRLIVFFAGHGYTETSYRGEVGFLVPSDGNASDLSSLIRWDDLTRNADLVQAKHILFLMDACYGGLAVTRSVRPGSMRFLHDMMQRISRQVLTAGKADEVVSDLGGPLPGHSVFTGHLINAFKGAAKDNLGILTAAGITAYVYQRVRSDETSNQTPHFGHIHGDGDMIFHPIPEASTDAEVSTGSDTLFSVPAVLHEEGDYPLTEIEHLKILLSEAKNKIRLFDQIAQKTRETLSVTADDYFPVQGQINATQFAERLATYESAVSELLQYEMLLGFWGEDSSTDSMKLPLKRLAERIRLAAGNVLLLNMRWYPVTLLLYAGGIGALAASNYRNLMRLMEIPVPDQHSSETTTLITGLTRSMVETFEMFKTIEGHKQQYAPFSEYLFKFLQPICDELLFVGTEYGELFDRFEVFLALQYAHEKLPMTLDSNERVWGPVGRFGWKQHRSSSPIKQIQDEANREGPIWEPLQVGFFGGSLDRFNELANGLQTTISKYGWF